MQDAYDVIVIGSGLAGMTAANTLARAGHSVLLLEQHSKLGGLATWFRRPRGHIFDVSLHGFPFGMVKSCRRYWGQEIADSIVQIKHIRFDNPMFSLSTTFDREDFTRLLTGRFGVPAATVEQFFDTARKMNFYDDQATTTGQLLDRFFPGRGDIERIGGRAHVSNLPEDVLKRMKSAALRRLSQFMDVRIHGEALGPDRAVGPGGAIALWAETPATILGADAIAEKGKRAEKVGDEAAAGLLAEIESGAAVDVHAADQVLPYAAIAREPSQFPVREVSEHARTMMWLLASFLGTQFETVPQSGLQRISVRPGTR